MAALARIDLGLASREFWEMTPRQLYFLVKRHEKRTEERWEHTSAMMAIYANCHIGPDSKPYDLDHFVPKKKAPVKKAEPIAVGLGPEVFNSFRTAFKEGGVLNGN